MKIALLAGVSLVCFLGAWTGAFFWAWKVLETSKDSAQFISFMIAAVFTYLPTVLIGMNYDQKD